MKMFENKKKCIVCGKEIVSHNGLKKYCSKCRQIKDKEFRKKRISASE